VKTPDFEAMGVHKYCNDRIGILDIDVIQDDEPDMVFRMGEYCIVLLRRSPAW